MRPNLFLTSQTRRLRPAAVLVSVFALGCHWLRQCFPRQGLSVQSIFHFTHARRVNRKLILAQLAPKSLVDVLPGTGMASGTRVLKHALRPAVVLVGVFALAPPTTAQTIPAFSGADGAAANVSGGRGGIVYHVTKLNSAIDDPRADRSRHDSLRFEQHQLSRRRSAHDRVRRRRRVSPGPVAAAGLGPQRQRLGRRNRDSPSAARTSPSPVRRRPGRA